MATFSTMASPFRGASRATARGFFRYTGIIPWAARSSRSASKSSPASRSHPVTEHMTVLSGRFFVGMGETMDKDAATAYGPGSYIAVAAGLPAYMWAEEVTVIQVHGVGPFSTQFVEPPSER